MELLLRQLETYTIKKKLERHKEELFIFPLIFFSLTIFTNPLPDLPTLLSGSQSGYVMCVMSTGVYIDQGLKTMFRSNPEQYFKFLYQHSV